MIWAGKSRWKFYSCWTVKLYNRAHRKSQTHSQYLGKNYLIFHIIVLKYSLYIRLCSLVPICFENTYVSFIRQRTLVKLCLHWTDPNLGKIASNAAFSISSSSTSISSVFATRAPNWTKGMKVLQKDQKIVSRESAGETWALVFLMNAVSPLRNSPAPPKTSSVP